VVTIGLHWVTVVLVLGVFASILLKDFAADRNQAVTFLYIHRSFGVTTWIVAICRLAWRLSFAFLPPFLETMSRVQQWLAKTSEYGLYAILLIQPLTGLAQSFTRGRPFFVLVWEVPSVMSRDNILTEFIETVHKVSAWVFFALIGLHVLAALFHRLILNDEVLQSMLPWKPSPHKGGSSDGTGAARLTDGYAARSSRAQLVERLAKRG
jgi:superoxide oxidase